MSFLLGGATKEFTLRKGASSWKSLRTTGLNQSEIVKGGPPLWLAAVQIFLYVCVRVDKCVTCAAAVRQKEVSSRDACSVANLATFSAFVDPHSNFLFSKKSN